MERLSIEEIIEHCNRHLNRFPSGTRNYQEHESTRAYLQMLRHYQKLGTPEQFAAWKKADEEGQLVVLPQTLSEDYDGLKVKYRVYKAQNNKPVENCFVLRPDKDFASRVALLAYAEAIENDMLKNDIEKWIKPDVVYVIVNSTDSYDGQPYKKIITANFRFVMLPCVGKTVFLTREAAEAALEAKEGE